MALEAKPLEALSAWIEGATERMLKTGSLDHSPTSSTASLWCPHPWKYIHLVLGRSHLLLIVTLLPLKLLVFQHVSFNLKVRAESEYHSGGK